VIHFVGDIHQPLHCADDNDRGGNDVWARISGKTDNSLSLEYQLLPQHIIADYRHT